MFGGPRTQVGQLTGATGKLAQPQQGGGFNVMNASANWLQNAGQNTRQAMNYDPKMVNPANTNLGRVQNGLFASAGYNPQNVQAAQAGLDGARGFLNDAGNYMPQNNQAANAGMGGVFGALGGAMGITRAASGF